LTYHVLNRAVARYPIFKTDKDHRAFQEIIIAAAERHPGVKLLAWCVMSNHWHFVARPTRDGELSTFFRWLTLTHAMRWRVAHRTVGYGPLYQGRFKSFPVQDEHGLGLVCRYVERNALSAGLVRRAQDWPWGSLHVRCGGGTPEQRALLADWPVPMPSDWMTRVNAVISEREAARVQRSIERGVPLGEAKWVRRAIVRLGLAHTERPEGRPRKQRRVR
jgi:putative transposase